MTSGKRHAHRDATQVPCATVASSGTLWQNQAIMELLLLVRSYSLYQLTPPPGGSGGLRPAHLGPGIPSPPKIG